jgi:hypothetical protein
MPFISMGHILSSREGIAIYPRCISRVTARRLGCERSLSLVQYQYMYAGYRRLPVLVAEQFLNRLDAVARFEQVRSK